MRKPKTRAEIEAHAKKLRENKHKIKRQLKKLDRHKEHLARDEAAEAALNPGKIKVAGAWVDPPPLVHRFLVNGVSKRAAAR